MAKHILFGFICLLFVPCLAQTDTTEVLSFEQLRSKPWFYSVEEAMARPDEVFKLSLKGKNLKQIPADVFRLPNLHILDVSDNRIQRVSPDIGRLNHLRRLNFFDNKLRGLPNEMGDLRHLVELYVGKNKLIAVPAWVGGLGELRHVDVSRNRLTPYEIGKLRYQLPNAKVTY